MHAYAKINWALAVVGRRLDGYHLLETWMQSVDLRDELTCEDAPDWALECDDASLCGEDNLVLRAARALEDRLGGSLGRKRFRLAKRIPTGGGMGGGSADAAAALRLLGEAWRVEEALLYEVAEKLGADVPFLLRGGSALCKGIGEEMHPLPLPSWPLLLIRPGEIGLSTAEIFRRYRQDSEGFSAPLQAEALGEALRRGDFALAQKYAPNDLLPASQSACPAIAQALRDLREAGAPFAQMTGSGVCVFGAFREEKARDTAFTALAEKYPHIWRAKTIDK